MGGFFDIFPTHDPNDRNDLRILWVNNWVSDQPLDRIRDYFGEEVTLNRSSPSCDPTRAVIGGSGVFCIFRVLQENVGLSRCDWFVLLYSPNNGSRE